jgi:hypothetical protein
MLLPLFTWLESVYNAMLQSPFGVATNLSVWLFAVVQAVHLLTLVVVGCAVLVVDLRLLGFGLRDQPIVEVAREAQPWLVWGLVGQVATGIPLFVSLAASKYYANPAFWLKMYLVVAAIGFTFTVRRLVAGRERRANGRAARLVGLMSILLWSGVGVMAKAIGYY